MVNPAAAPLDDIRFWLQVIEDSRRTLYVQPAEVARIEALCRAFPLVEVKANPLVPAGQAWLVDQNALSASINRGLQPKPVTYRPTADYRRFDTADPTAAFRITGC